MKLFNTIAIEIGAVCNRRCEFCPNAYYSRPDEFMPVEMIEKILNSLKELKYSGRIEFYIYNEPMRDERLLGILQLTRRVVPRSSLMIATNGDYIRNEQNVIDLFKAGLNQLQINVYTNPHRYEFFIEMINQLEFLDQESSIYHNCSPSKMICRVVDKTHYSNFTGIYAFTNRSGLISDFRPPVKEPLERMCVKPFRILNINWKGDAILCCNDYFGEITSGNISSVSLTDLWDNRIFNFYRRRLLLKDRRMKLCDLCDASSGAYSHNVPTDFSEK